MPVNKADEYRHNNPDSAFVDSRFVRGGRRVVADREELYGLVIKADQLLENVTIVRILSDGENGGTTTEVLLVDDTAIGSAAGWQLYTTGTSQPAPNTGTGFSFQKFTFDVPQDGANAFDLPAGASDVFPAVKVQQASTYLQRPVRTLNDDHYRVENGQLLISSAAGLRQGDTVIGTAILGTGSPGAGIDYNNVPQAVQDAVSDASNTWSYGDLTAYGSTDLETAALADVVKGMYFDSFEQGSTTDAYRYCYCLQNDGTLGWTRLLKYS